jgi:amino acid transporter
MSEYVIGRGLFVSELSAPTPALDTPAPALRRGALGLRHAVVISVAVMSPAASIFFNTIPQAGLVGAAVPLCYVVGFVIALLVASQYSELSRELPSSGSAYTFVMEGLGRRWGFLTGWIGLIAVALGAPYSFILMSTNLETLVQRWFGLNLHWSFWFVLAIGFVFALCYLGIRQSLSVDMTLLAFEMGICLVLALIVLLSVGSHGGLTAAPFNPNQVPANGDLTVGIILAVLSFIGFETAAALGEETRNPHRNIPRAVFGSMVVVGLFYVIMAYVATVGYGVNKMVSGYANDNAPFDTISRLFGNPLLASLIDLAGVLSFFGAALAIINGGSRILYTVGRDGLLPRWTTILHAKRQTPVGAIIGLCLCGLVGGIGLGLLLTPIGAFAFLGTLDALFVLLIYLLTNIACVRFFWRKRRSQFNIVRHGIFPVLSALIITAIFLSSRILWLSGSRWGPLAFICCARRWRQSRLAALKLDRPEAPVLR